MVSALDSESRLSSNHHSSFVPYPSVSKRTKPLMEAVILIQQATGVCSVDHVGGFRAK